MKTKLSNGATIGSRLDEVFNSLVREDRHSPNSKLRLKTLEEEEKQKAVAPENDDIFSDDDEIPTSDAKTKQSEPAPAPVKADTAEIGRKLGGPQKKMADDDVESLTTAPEATDVIDKLNSIRSGKSFKDDEILGAFNTYFDGLKNEEKIALFAFLKGIAQVTTGEVGGADAVEPGDKPADINMSKGSNDSQKSPNTKSIKPNIVNKEQKPTSQYANGKEDTASPLPIKPTVRS